MGSHDVEWLHLYPNLLPYTTKFRGTLDGACTVYDTRDHEYVPIGSPSSRSSRGKKGRSHKLESSPASHALSDNDRRLVVRFSQKPSYSNLSAETSFYPQRTRRNKMKPLDRRRGDARVIRANALSWHDLMIWSGADHGVDERRPMLGPTRVTMEDP